MRITNDVLAVLDQADINGNAVRLTGTLDRNLYVRTDKVLKAAGGTWNRKAGAHLFADSDPAAILEQVILTGQITTAQDMGYFPTPPGIVAKMISLAKLRPGMTVLEPSAGTGAIAIPAAQTGATVDTVEIDEARALALANAAKDTAGLRTLGIADFLTLTVTDFPDGRYDRVLMNPPFAKQQDIEHVQHALRLVKPGGMLVSVMSQSVLFRANRRTEEFREVITALGGYFEPLPDDAFKPSGTLVQTVLAVVPH